MRNLLLALILLLSHTILAQKTVQLEKGQESPKASIEDVSWIAGHWEGEAFGGKVEEVWTPPNGNSMMCAFKHLKDDEVTFYEICIIRELDQSLILQLKHFNNDLKGWESKDETVDFKLVKLEENKAYFEGFTFEKLDDDHLSLFVVIGMEDGVNQEMAFHYSRSNQKQ